MTSDRRWGFETGFTGLSWLRFQGLLLLISLSVSAIMWLLRQEADPISTAIYTLVAGNVTTLVMEIATPHFPQRFPLNWMVFVLALLPTALVASSVAASAMLLRITIVPGNRLHYIVSSCRRFHLE